MRSRARVGVEPEWIVRRTGHRGAPPPAPGDATHRPRHAAARPPWSDAGVEGVELDAVLVATASADLVMPAAAPLVATRHRRDPRDVVGREPGLHRLPAGLEQAAALIECGRAAAVLVIAAEALSRVTDHGDRKTAALFGDGAGAVVLTAVAPARSGPPSSAPTADADTR